MQESLTGKVAWVIGGGSGIGAGIARELGLAGATVVISGRRVDHLRQETARLQSEGIAVVGIRLDVSRHAELTAAHDQIVRLYGPVNILVSSAGTNVTKRFWSDLNPQDFGSVVDVNLTGVVRAIHAVLPGMRAFQDGLIIVISSWAGWRFAPGAGAAYATSKTALGALVESVNSEEKSNGIRATHLCPGEVKTDILNTRPVVPSDADQELMLVPADVGRLVRFIAESPVRLCFNEVVLTPTTNTSYRT